MDSISLLALAPGPSYPRKVITTPTHPVRSAGRRGGVVAAGLCSTWTRGIPSHCVAGCLGSTGLGVVPEGVVPDRRDEEPIEPNVVRVATELG